MQVCKGEHTYMLVCVYMCARVRESVNVYHFFSHIIGVLDRLDIPVKDKQLEDIALELKRLHEARKQQESEEEEADRQE